jgi:hypothetical protein
MAQKWINYQVFPMVKFKMIELALYNNQITAAKAFHKPRSLSVTEIMLGN